MKKKFGNNTGNMGRRTILTRYNYSSIIGLNLAVCLAVLTVIVMMCTSCGPQTSDKVQTPGNEAAEAGVQTSADEEGADREEAGRAAAEDDEPAENAPDLSEYIRISPHFYYRRPEGIEQVWTPEETYANNETLCDFRYDGDLYTVRSYVIDYRDGGLSDIVKEELSAFEGMTFTGQDTVKGKNGDLLW